jgi:hypothetical protein
MKKLLQILMLTTTLSTLSIFAETKNAFACYARPLPNIELGDSMAKVIQDLIDNGGCGEQLILTRYDENTVSICAAIDGGDEPIGIQLLVRDLIVIQRKITKFDENSPYSSPCNV